MKIVIALGGNALGRDGKSSYSEQLSTVRKTVKLIKSLIESGYKVIITHGNGPQVGDIMLQQELAKNKVSAMPLSVAGAESQGEIGYMLQQQLQNELETIGSGRKVITLLSQVLVDKDDSAFKNPSKFIGPFYSTEKAKSLRRKYTIKKQDKRGWRRVVPSPKPVKILEEKAIKLLFEKGYVVICCGGGGVPVVKTRKRYEGVSAVIDKDRTSALLGKLVSADILLILTDVDYVYLDYGKKNQRKITKLKLDEAQKLLMTGEFQDGSIGPKVESAINFVRSGGKKTIITQLSKMNLALHGKVGTVISK